jgi:hypothetical protein
MIKSFENVIDIEAPVGDFDCFVWKNKSNNSYIFRVFGKSIDVGEIKWKMNFFGQPIEVEDSFTPMMSEIWAFEDLNDGELESDVIARCTSNIEECVEISTKRLMQKTPEKIWRIFGANSGKKVVVYPLDNPKKYGGFIHTAMFGR